MYQARYMPAADQDMADLDPPVAKRIYKRVKWLSENLDSITPEPLEGPWKGKYKFRVGDYRVIYSIAPDGVRVLKIGHRRDVHREAESRLLGWEQ